MHKVIEKVLVTQTELKKIIKRMAKEIDKDFKDTPFLMVGLLKGCYPFLSNLTLNMKLDFPVEFLNVSCYEGGDKRKGEGLKIHDYGLFSVKDKNILIVDDIIDSGITLEILKNKFLKEGAKSVKIAVLLDKPKGRKTNIKADYVGVEIPNEFVIGFGLDYDELYRNIPYVGVFNKKYLK